MISDKGGIRIMGVDGMSNADIFDEYFDDEKPKYIIKNCPAYDCSITEWNCLGSDATECKNGNCILKQIVELCKNIDCPCEYQGADCWECSRIGAKTFADKILKLIDIQEVE